MTTTTLLDTWTRQKLTSDEIANRLETIVNSRQWVNFFCMLPNGQIAEYCKDTPDKFEGYAAGVCYSNSCALNIAQVSILELISTHILPTWLLMTGNNTTAIKLHLDNICGYATINGNPKTTSIVAIQLKKSAETKSGFYIEKIIPIFVDNVPGLN